MARSAFATFVDAICRRPEWIEQDGDREALVQGYSIVDSCLAFVAGLIMVAASVAVLVTLP